MANVKISQLPAATTPLGGNEELPLVQNSTTKKALVSSINAKATLQQVTAGPNKNLTNGINLQGTGAGGTNSGSDINAFGTSACGTNTGSRINAFGNAAASGNSGTDVNAIGDVSAGNNTGSDVNSMGSNSCNGNDGSDVNSFGNSAGKDNDGNDVNFFGNNAGVGNVHDSVNIFGRNAVADDKGQTVFGFYDGNTTFNARVSYIGLSDDRKYELPDKSGTLVLSVNGNLPDAEGDVTISAGSGPQVATVTITSSQLLTINSSPITLVAAPGANKVIMPVNISYVYQYNTSTYTSSLVTARINGIICNSGFDISLSTSFFTVQNTTQLATSTNLINQPVLLRGNNDPTTGDGTLTVTLTYNVINL